MAVTTNVSFLAQSTSQISRLKELHSSLDDLQRQVTTRKKHEDFSGFGVDALNLQRLRASKNMTENYLKNIDTVSRRMDLMNQSMNEIIKVSRQVLNAVQVQGQSAATEMKSVNQLAADSLKFVEDLINQTFEGRYLFAGADAETAPFIDHSTLNSNFINRISTWLGGGGNAGLTSAIDGFTSTNLGLSPGLATSSPVTMRIDDSIDIDYTVKADHAGFKEIIRSLTLLANLKYPDPVGPPPDVATPAEFQGMLDYASDKLSKSIQTMSDTSKSLASKFALTKSIKDNHEQDLQTMLTQIDDIENVNPSDAILSLQSVQSQLTAAYQVTKIVKDISLVNYL